MGHTHRYKFGFEKKTGKESQYMVSHPELGSDPPIESDRESGRDMIGLMAMVPMIVASQGSITLIRRCS